MPPCIEQLKSSQSLLFQYLWLGTDGLKKVDFFGADWTKRETSELKRYRLFTVHRRIQVAGWRSSWTRCHVPCCWTNISSPKRYVSSLEGNFQINWFSSMELHCNDTVASIVNAPENAFRRPLWWPRSEGPWGIGKIYEKWISHHCLNSQDRSQWYKNFSLLTLAPWVGVNGLIVIQVERCKENGSSKLQTWGWNGLLSLSPTISTILSGRALCICGGVQTEVQFTVWISVKKKVAYKKGNVWLNPPFFLLVSQEKKPILQAV